ncbi:MAG TPA: restriction endonuclease [Pseudomonas sp.]|nr:restriction endonuclease [Pseudomonas sp.]
MNSFSHDFTVSLSKSFLLLAGISGTGKTRFVREQAKATGSLADTYCLTPVRPDWHEPSDLLGYISRLNGEAEYIATDVLKFIAKAWRAKVDAGLSLGVNDTDKEQRGYLIVSGAAGDLNAIPPYWLCLDEMNLAPVEQYFADYLSILETREWCWEDDAFKYFSAPLLTAGTLQHLGKLERDKLRKHLGFKNEGEAKAEDELWGLICEYGMGIPFNLIVAGTVNMDETTHGFSRKVIDRALSFDFGEFFPNDYAEFFEPTIGNKALSYPVLSHANYSQDKLPSIDSDGQKSIDFLDAVNTVLDNTPFRLAYRALNELLLAVISEAPDDQDTLHLQAIWDDFLMCKVLPRIEGDSDKLMTDDSQQSLLQKLSQCLTTQLAEIWNEAEGAGTARPDLYREKAATEGDAKVLRIACRSKAKLEWMQKRLERSGFTSFWP